MDLGFLFLVTYGSHFLILTICFQKKRLYWVSAALSNLLGLLHLRRPATALVGLKATYSLNRYFSIDSREVEVGIMYG